MAKLLGLPVVLVLDSRGVTRGMAPLLLGYQQFDPQIRIAAVILNQVGGPRHESKLRAVIEHYTGIPILGAIAKKSGAIIEERHLGLVPSNEAEETEAIIERLAEDVRGQIDLEQLLALVATPVPSWPSLDAGTSTRYQGLRIGIARDSAFGFYYADDLEAFEHLGAELVFFSPLADSELPEVDGIFLGGGFPETHMVKLAANSAMLASIRHFVEAGRPAYAECGGLMYLCRSLKWGGKEAQMAGIIQADAVILDRPQGRGYVCLKEQAAHPWPGGRAGQKLPVHEFHYSRLENLDAGYDFAWQITRGDGIDGRNDGLIYKGLLAGYAHQRQVEGNLWVERFLARVASYK
jgi:cobyrinic acid a,c-diamide synthase